MSWIDSVCSTRCQMAKMTTSSTANTGVLTVRLTPSLSVNKSVICVPTTLTSTTVSQ